MACIGEWEILSLESSWINLGSWYICIVRFWLISRYRLFKMPVVEKRGMKLTGQGYQGTLTSQSVCKLLFHSFLSNFILNPQ